MTIDDAIAVTEMTTDVATILSKILLKSCLLTYLNDLASWWMAVDAVLGW